MTNQLHKEEILEKRVGAPVKTSAPTVSVIIPAYNVAQFISETLESVFAQSFKDYEIVLVNDGSADTENLEKVLQKYPDRIVYIKQSNCGAAAARNAGIEHSRGSLLAFLDGDDVWLPQYLEKQISGLRAKNCDLIYADAEMFGDTPFGSQTFMDSTPSAGAVTTESLINGSCSVITSGTVVKRELIETAGGFDPEAAKMRVEDFDLWFRLARSGARLNYQKEVLLKYRVRADGLSGSSVKFAERNVAGLDFFAGKYELNASEKAALEKQRRFAAAELELELGKHHLARENFGEALVHFRNADRFYEKLKLKIIIFLLRVRPRFAAGIFKRLRPDAVKVVDTGNG